MPISPFSPKESLIYMKTIDEYINVKDQMISQLCNRANGNLHILNLIKHINDLGGWELLSKL